MALLNVNESDEDEYHSMESRLERDDVGESDVDDSDEPPVHPIPSLQAAFEESILESTAEDNDLLDPTTASNAESRRNHLLESRQYDDSWTSRWKQRPGARHHPLIKLMAQIIFGMHLLEQQQAKSNEEVVKILQTHVNEVDTFLERTAEDFGLALADVDERIRHLKLPMKHLHVFKVMLDDKRFRTQLLDGNDNIEKIIDRTARAMKAALMDVEKGIQATAELGRYLETIKDHWPKDRRDIAGVYGAMRGNEQGWMKYLKDLQTKGDRLGNSLTQLGAVIGEMSKLAAAASRRHRPTSKPTTPARSAPTSPGLRSKFSSANDAPPPPTIPPIIPSLNKPLPREPGSVSVAADSPIPKLHQPPSARHRKSPHSSPLSPSSRSPRPAPITTNGTPKRPKTAGDPREARTAARDTTTADLVEFFSHSPNPLRSNPPDEGEVKKIEDKVARSRSNAGAVDLLSAARSARTNAAVVRARTYGVANGGVVAPIQDNKTEMESQPTTPGTAKASSDVSERTDRNDSIASTGFARRISKRMRDITGTSASPEHRKLERVTPSHIPITVPEYTESTISPPTTSSPTTTTTSPTTITTLTAAELPSAEDKSPPLPPDSGYSSGSATFPKHPPTDPLSPTLDAETKSSRAEKVESEKREDTEGQKAYHPPPLHPIMFPQKLPSDDPVTPSASIRSGGTSLTAKEDGPGGGWSSNSPASSSRASKGRSINLRKIFMGVQRGVTA